MCDPNVASLSDLPPNNRETAPSYCLNGAAFTAPSTTLIRLADAGCRERPSRSRTHWSRCGRSRGGSRCYSWTGYYRRLLHCRFLGSGFLCCCLWCSWLSGWLGNCFLRCRFLGYGLFGSRSCFLGCRFFGGWFCCCLGNYFLRCRFLGYGLFGSRSCFLGCRFFGGWFCCCLGNCFLGCRFFCCGFSFLCCYHFNLLGG